MLLAISNPGAQAAAPPARSAFSIGTHAVVNLNDMLVLATLGTQGQLQPAERALQEHEEAGGNHAQAGSHEGEAEGEGHEALRKAEAIAVTAPPSWYPTVITIIIVLFLLAASFGMIAVLSKAPEPDDHAAAAHGGDDHHGHGGGNAVAVGDHASHGGH